MMRASAPYVPSLSLKFGREFRIRIWIVIALCLLPSISMLAIDLKVSRPEVGEALTRVQGQTFVIGTVDPPDAEVFCNGVACEVDDDGAFLGFVPIRMKEGSIEAKGKWCDAEFEFVVCHGEEEARLVVPTYTQRSPSSAIPAQESFIPSKRIRVKRDQWIGLEGKDLGNFIFVPEGAIVNSEFGDARAFRCKFPQGPEISIPISESEIVLEDSMEPSLIQPVEIRVPDQKTIVTSWNAPAFLERNQDRLAWGVRTKTIEGIPYLESRWHLRGDGRRMNPERPLEGLRVCLDPGHHPDRGAVGPRGFEERESTLLIARETARLLEREGVEVSLTREEDALPLRERHARMRELKPDLVVSIHNNSVGDGQDPRQKHGTQTFYLYPWAKPFAEAMHRSMLEHLGTRDLGCIRRNLYVTRFMECPSILIEPEYLILPDQEKRFMNSEYRRHLAKAIVEGIKNFVVSAEKADPEMPGRGVYIEPELSSR